MKNEQNPKFDFNTEAFRNSKLTRLSLSYQSNLNPFKMHSMSIY